MTRTDPLAPPGYLHVNTYSERELHERLVADAIAGIATPLDWCVAAYTRIGKLNRRGAEVAYREVRTEVLAAGVGYDLPMA